MPIGLFKKRNDGFGNLSVSPRSKRRNRGTVIWDHRGAKNKKPSDLLKMSPTYPQSETTLNLDDYGKKVSITEKIRRSSERLAECFC